MMPSKSQTIRVRGEEFSVSADDIIAVATRETPRRLNAYYVEIKGKKFPPKQLLRSALTAAPPFDTGVAVRALHALGFHVVKLAE
jgi:hypothetical protein